MHIKLCGQKIKKGSERLSLKLNFASNVYWEKVNCYAVSSGRLMQSVTFLFRPNYYICKIYIGIFQ